MAFSNWLMFAQIQSGIPFALIKLGYCFPTELPFPDEWDTFLYPKRVLEVQEMLNGCCSLQFFLLSKEIPALCPLFKHSLAFVKPGLLSSICVELDWEEQMVPFPLGIPLIPCVAALSSLGGKSPSLLLTFHFSYLSKSCILFSIT